MDFVDDPAQRALLAEALLEETEPPSAETVIGAIVSLQKRQIERQIRDLRAQIAEAERRGDSVEVVPSDAAKIGLGSGTSAVAQLAPGRERLRLKNLLNLLILCVDSPCFRV